VSKTTIQIRVFDFSVADWLKPEKRGHYYDVGADEPVENAGPLELVLDGPHPSRQAALDAAKDYINDAVTEHSCPSN
jgi:hypothetical protein